MNIPLYNSVFWLVFTDMTACVDNLYKIDLYFFQVKYYSISLYNFMAQVNQIMFILEIIIWFSQIDDASQDVEYFFT